MAKIDISKIENFSTLTADELRKFFTEFEYEDNSAELAKLKADAQKLIKAKDSATSEAAEFKRKLREQLTEEERKSAEAADELQKLKDENASYKKSAQVLSFKSAALALGYSEDLAQKRAEAMAEGDFKSMNDIDKEFIEAHDKEIKNKAMNSLPYPPAGGKEGTASITAAAFRKMNYRELADLKQKNPELYKKLNEEI